MVGEGGLPWQAKLCQRYGAAVTVMDREIVLVLGAWTARAKAPVCDDASDTGTPELVATYFHSRAEVLRHDSEVR